MNGRRILGLWLVLGLLGCSGLLAPDPARIAALELALADVDPLHARDLLVRGSVEAGSVHFGCASAFDALPEADPSQRAAILAQAFDDWTTFCPSPCAADIGALAGLEPADRIDAALAQCDGAGADPVFDGAMTALRPQMAPMDYLAVRKLTEIAYDVSPTFASVRPKLAVGLVLEGAPTDLVPAAELFVDASRDVAPEALEALQTAIRACGPDTVVAHRVVVDPRGRVAGVAGPDSGCVVEALEAWTLPSPDGRYTVVDIAWKPEPLPPPVVDDSDVRERPVPRAAPVDGPMVPEDIQRVLRGNKGTIRYCYEKQLARDPSLTGEVVVRFVVGPSGKVSDAKTVSSTIPSPELDRCLEIMFRKFTFPASSETLTVSWPMRFVPG